MYIKVLVELSSFNIDKTFTYHVPDYLMSKIKVGIRVKVPFNNQKLEGFVLEILDNIDNTFVTPVFNGSTSLRSAAGTRIENVTKAKRRKKTVDDAFIDDLYDEVYSLYHLDQTSAAGGAVAKDLGPLPTESVVLLSTLVVVWIILGIVYFLRIKKN